MTGLTCSLILNALFDGRNQLKATYLMSVEMAEGLLNEIGSESLVSGTHTSPSVVAQKIDSVATADVVNVSMHPHLQVFLSHCKFFFIQNWCSFVCVYKHTRVLSLKRCNSFSNRSWPPFDVFITNRRPFNPVHCKT